MTTRYLIGLLLGTEDDWPTAFTEILSRLGPVVGSSRVDLQACKLEYSIVSPK